MKFLFPVAWDVASVVAERFVRFNGSQCFSSRRAGELRAGSGKVRSALEPFQKKICLGYIASSRSTPKIFGEAGSEVVGAATMEGSHGSNGTSLERLKALDYLQDLDEQLREIKQLCTHSARAEMIAKWLLCKLQTDTGSSWRTDAWDMLLSTLRILPPERVAASLGVPRLLKTLQTALTEGKPEQERLQSSARILSFLLEQSNAPAGVAVRAGLCLPAAEAAQFTGVWLRHHLAISQSRKGLTRDNLWNDAALALQIWYLRKRSSEENEAFSKHCLVQCAALLSRIPHVDEISAMKRKRDSEAGSASVNLRAGVERLLARHVFLPGRAAFFKAHSGGNGRRQREVGSQRPSFVIESLLQTLASLSGSSQDSAIAPPKSLPQLLDLALRSVQTPSPTHRTQEKPWIEALFLALHHLNKASDGRLINTKALCDMLDVIARRSCTVSSEVLTEVLRAHAGLGTEPGDGVDWDIVAAVGDVDASLFKDTAAATTLFDAITEASIKLGEDRHEYGLDSEARTKHTLWRDRIVIPVMNAFARYNDLPTALELCSKQLENDLHGTFWSVWNHLDEPIAVLLEETLTEEQTHSICLRYCSTIADANERRETGEIAKLSAAVTMFNAILKGIRSEITLDKLQTHLGNTFEALVELHDVYVGPGLISALQERRCWSLMTTIFEHWFPRYAAQQQDAAAVVTKMSALVPDSVIDRAIDLTATVHPEEYGSVEDPQSASDAKQFVACLCSHMTAYKNLGSDLALRPFIDALDDLGQQRGFDSGDKKLFHAAFLRHADILNFLGAAPRQAMLSELLQSAMNDHSSSAVSDLEYLKTLGSTAAAGVQHAIIDDLIVAASACPKYASAKIYENKMNKGVLFAEIFSAISAKALTRPQREKLLDEICGWHFEQGIQPTEVLKPCLPLMLRLMECSNPTARLCLGPKVIITMATDLNDGLQTRAEDDATAIACFEALTSAIIQQCTRTKDQERSRMMLIALSAETVKIVQAITGSEDEPPILPLKLVKAVYRDLETHAVDDLKAQLPHRKPSATNKLLTTLAAMVESQLEDWAAALLHSLDVLRSIPVSLINASGFDLAPILASLATFLDTWLRAGLPELSQQRKGEFPYVSVEAVMASCYQTLGKFAPPTPNVQLVLFADGLLRQDLVPFEHAAVLSTFEGLVTTLGSSRIALVQELLNHDPFMLPSRLLLLQLCIGKLENSDFEQAEDCQPTRILHRLLGMLSASTDFTVSRRILSCVTDMLRKKTFMVNQYNIEMILRVLHQLTQRGGSEKNILYLDICNSVSILLLHHRSRLQGRFHMVIKLLQGLLSRLFQPIQGWDKETARRPPTIKHAVALSRLLKLFCEPPHLRKTQQLRSLVDESRKEQAHVGTFVQHVLHHYCAQILHGTLGDGMKDALTPGLRAMIEAMEMNGAEGGKALSAAMSNSERAVLRGLYEEWRRFGKWRGG